MTFEAEVRQLLELRARRRRFPSPEQPAVIYGAGNRGRELRHLLNARGYQVDRFLDRSTSTTSTIEGLSCYPPTNAYARSRPGEFALVGIWRPDVDLHPIVGEIRSLGYEVVMTVYDFVDEFGSIIRQPFWQTQSAFYLTYVDDLCRLGSLLADAESRLLLTEVLRLRLLGDTSVLRSPDADAGYMPSGVVQLNDECCFVDGGAYTGDTFTQIAKRGIRLSGYVALEPDLVNFRKLVSSVASNARRPLETLLLPVAAWNETCQLTFSAAGSEESALSSVGGTSVTAVALDDVLLDFRPDLLKLDIEGAEPEALCGAQKIIARTRPILAITVYHKPDHLWSIPFLIDSWCLKYRFYLRYHQMGGNDLVLYAIPQ